MTDTIMKQVILLFTLVLLAACGVKQTRKMVASGDYDSAISKAVGGLQSNKNAKGKQDYVYLLEEAFAKAKERDLRDIAGWGWFKDANPKDFEAIFNTYKLLNDRQEMIRPLLPLKLLKENRDAKFPMDDYTEQIMNSKNALSKYLYLNSVAALISNDKMRCRRAYDDLVYLNQINPGYKDVTKLIGDAQLKGTDFVIVSAKNETNAIVPKRLNDDLLDFSTFGLNDKWTAYHNAKQQGIVYDYGVEIHFRGINISPERINEKEFYKEKIIKDGVKKLLDARGREVKDSLGKPIYVDNMKTVQIAIYESAQQKAAQVTAKVDYVNLKTNQLLETFPLSSEFVFQNVYARYKGDRRACEADYLQNFDRRQVPFPTNEQMVYDCGEDLKNKLKDIISSHSIGK
ncbi:hypothetical protein [Flavobacterium sp.]|uniref:hypothetical protein n=1 Tax=Flavobacterium sp. TaxID=239 RepID=UPI00286D51B7|nr:hypothetical protein [Flavobacterium sp.]